MRPLLLIVWLFSLATSVGASQFSAYPELEYAPPAADNGEILVDFENDQEVSVISSLLRSAGIPAGEYHWFSSEEKWLRIRNISTAILSKLRKSSRVEAVEPNYYLSAMYVPNDPYYKHQWHLDLIGMKEAWDYPRGGDVVVAVIDTGIAYENFRDHFRAEDLNDSQFAHPRNFLRGNEHANDDHGHGTHVAGTIAQLTNNGIGVAGTAPQVRLMPLKVLNASGYGTISAIASAIRYAADHGARVINMSLGGPFPSFILHKAIRYAHSKGVVIVCAAGNSGRSGLSYPAAYPECISVSAVRYDRTLTWYSSYGKGLTIAAPGGDLNVDQNGDGLMDGVLQNTLNPQDRTKQGYFLFQGTSMATPHVAAAAALLISHGVQDPEKVREYLQKTATSVEGGSSDKYGAGILDVNAALKSAFYYRKSKILLLGLICLILLVAALNRGRTSLQKVPIGFLAPAGLLVGSTGFFFLSAIPFAGDLFAVTHAVPEWKLFLPSLSGLLDPLFYSAVPALVVLTLLYPWKGLVRFALGFAVGSAAFLFFQAFSPVSGLEWIPGRLIEIVWLVLHGFFALILAFVAAFRFR